MNGCYLLGSDRIGTRGSVDVTQDDYVETQADVLIPMWKTHARVVTSQQQDTVLPLYLRAAVNIAENITSRDVFQHTRTYVARDLREPFRFSRGVYTDLAMVNDGSPPVSVLNDYDIVGGVGPKSYGFVTHFNAAPYVKVSLKSGYANLLTAPSDLLGFIFAAAGMMYEVRELLNYTSMVQHADALPMYLIEPWAIPGMA